MIRARGDVEGSDMEHRPARPGRIAAGPQGVCVRATEESRAAGQPLNSVEDITVAGNFHLLAQFAIFKHEIILVITDGVPTQVLVRT
jgi:hypothetical protein